MLVTQNRLTPPQKASNLGFGASKGFAPCYINLVEKSLGRQSFVLEGNNKIINALSNHTFFISNYIGYGKYENTFISLKKKLFGNYVIKAPISTITQLGMAPDSGYLKIFKIPTDITSRLKFTSKKSTLSPALDWKTLSIDEADNLLSKAFKQVIAKKGIQKIPTKTKGVKVFETVKNILIHFFKKGEEK